MVAEEAFYPIHKEEARGDGCQVPREGADGGLVVRLRHDDVAHREDQPVAQRQLRALRSTVQRGHKRCGGEVINVNVHTRRVLCKASTGVRPSGQCNEQAPEQQQGTARTWRDVSISTWQPWGGIIAVGWPVSSVIYRTDTRRSRSRSVSGGGTKRRLTSPPWGYNPTHLRRGPMVVTRHKRQDIVRRHRRRRRLLPRCPGRRGFGEVGDDLLGAAAHVHGGTVAHVVRLRVGAAACGVVLALHAHTNRHTHDKKRKEEYQVCQAVDRGARDAGASAHRCTFCR